MQLSPRQKWKLRQWQNSIEAFKEKFRDFFKTAMVKQKVCPACRALVGANETRCPFCNESISILNRVGVRRVTFNFSGSYMPEMNYAWMLVALNFLMFGIELVAGARAGAPLGGLMGIPGRPLVDLGSNYGFLVLHGEFWRLLTGAFLHGDLMHLLFNMWVLADVGSSVEEMYGSTRFIVLYVFAALCGSLASVWWYLPGFVNMVGASGAIFGLFGVMIAYGYSRRTGMAEQIRSMFIRWALFGLVFGFLMRADNAAHLGGLAGGLLFGFLVSDMPPVTRESIMLWRLLNFLCWLAIAGGVVMVAVTMIRYRG